MAKVTGPLFSLDARGKLGSALVFIGWKGIKTVRQWLKPANPKSDDQATVRTIIGGLGRAIGKVAKDKAFHDQLITLDLIPDQQSKQSFLVQYIKDYFVAGAGVTMLNAYTGQLASMKAHTASGAWATAADALGILEFSVPYGATSAFDKRLGLYLLARAAIALDLAGSPYTLGLASWTPTSIYAMASHMTQ